MSALRAMSWQIGWRCLPWRAEAKTCRSKDDRVDRILLQAQLAGVDFFDRQLDPESSDPQLYVNECSNSIFSLLQKEYAPHRVRALAATARLEKMPALLRTGRTN